MTAPPPTSAQQAHPLRPYYQPPEDSVFIATAPRFSTTGTPGASAAASSSKAIGSASSSKPTPNRYMSSNDAKPYVATTSASGFGEADASISDIFRALLLSGALQYTSTCLAMPFEVGKLLLQVQWVPRDDVWISITQQAALAQRRAVTVKPKAPRPQSHEEEGPDAWEQEVSPEANEWDEEANAHQDELEDEIFEADLSDEDDADAYFRDVTSKPSRPDTSLYSGRKKQRMVDASGYVMRKSVYDQGARPEFVMPVVVRGGVWEMMKAVGRGKEGWLGLWKGSLTSFVLEVTSSTIQPIISSVLSLFAPTALSPLPLAYAPYPYKTLGLLLSSHLITGILVSPLDLVRTRLIAQSTLPAHRKYSGPYDAIKKTLREEGGWKTAYLHPNLLIPTILDFTLRPLLSLGAPLLIEHTLRLEPNTHPISYAIAELAITTASLCITLPIETVRRRLQLQIRKPVGAIPEEATASLTRKITSATVQRQQQTTTTTTSHGGISLTTSNVGVRGLRTCVETRPIAYVGVVEAIYRIVTEETVATHVQSAARADPSSDEATGSGAPAASASAETHTLAQSGILAAKTGHSSLGGLRSLYRGFGMAFSANLVVFMLTLVSAYKLSTVDGQADIGAYHVQPGRCAGVEQRLRARYRYFFGASPFHTAFDQLTHPAPSSNSDQMDATALCAFNPLLTEGYGGGFDNMNFYLVYSRCIYGTDEMRVLCGTTDGKGVPIDSYFNLIQARCPRGMKCKNLCASMVRPELTSPFAAKQVQLAQCMAESQWQTLTDMYRPQNASAPASPAPASSGNPAKPKAAAKPSKVDPTVVDKPPVTNPTKDQTHTAKDGTIPGKVLPPDAAATGDDAAKPNPPPKAPAPPAASSPATPDAGQAAPHHSTDHLQTSPLVILLPQQPQTKPPPPPAPKSDDKPAPPTAADPHPADPKPADSKKADPKDGAGTKDEQGRLPLQKAPTSMGFRKRSLRGGSRRRHRRGTSTARN
ncbi:hypothetical protein EX895_000765 [Sporisorium graminicola]|uniref:Mitochondrial carrier n=1 Tax=Sporisorium graminicola TaxID=280036 RepID=A0A4U7L220_9BASI|nr:hypothetical protein EX895_000765 [Sporisorium graminicola]TKY90767.1 hypothetical protein EX895_000765 [Sporisorium graminicola]